MGSVTFRRRIPLRHRVGVLVAGGGPAGVAAAVTAARQGVRVLLVEGQSCRELQARLKDMGAFVPNAR
jgi:flavin-dependent dehydrogenase